MIPSKRLITKVFASLHSTLREAGWVKRKPHMFSLDVSSECFGVVALNTASGRGKGIYEVNPIVGVGSYRLEKLVGELTGIKFKPCTSAAVAHNIGYLMPECSYKPWLFHEDEDCEAMAVDLVATVDKFGRPYMRKLENLETLYAELRRNCKTPANLQRNTIPVACVLLGRSDDAEEFLQDQLRQMAERTDMAAEDFRAFAARLREHIAKGKCEGSGTPSRSD